MGQTDIAKAFWANKIVKIKNVFICTNGIKKMMQKSLKMLNKSIFK